jgi:hypothetical protein
MKCRAYFLREVPRPRGIDVSDGDETDRRMGGGELCAQRADAPGAHNGDPEILALRHPFSG